MQKQIQGFHNLSSVDRSLIENHNVIGDRITIAWVLHTKLHFIQISTSVADCSLLTKMVLRYQTIQQNMCSCLLHRTCFLIWMEVISLIWSHSSSSYILCLHWSNSAFYGLFTEELLHPN